MAMRRIFKERLVTAPSYTWVGANELTYFAVLETMVFLVCHNRPPGLDPVAINTHHMVWVRA